MEQFTTETIYVDAVLAEKMLEANRWHTVGEKGTNRKISKRTVTKYAIAMADGRWIITHQGLAFGEDGKLVDGQHRLLAVIEADKLKPGIVIGFRVTTGVSEHSFKFVDSGLRRKPGDVASAYGAPSAFQVAATARLFNSYMNIPFESPSSWMNPPQWDSSLIPATIDEYPCIIDAVMRVSSKRFTGNLTSISTGYALAMELRPDTDPEKFIWRLETGQGDVRDGAPAYMLREKLALMQRTGHNARQIDQLAYFIKAYNKYILGEDIRAFRFVPAEGFPRIIANLDMDEE